MVGAIGVDQYMVGGHRLGCWLVQSMVGTIDWVSLIYGKMTHAWGSSIVRSSVVVRHCLGLRTRRFLTILLLLV